MGGTYQANLYGPPAEQPAPQNNQPPYPPYPHHQQDRNSATKIIGTKLNILKKQRRQK
jgi:hypothetical protein